MNLIRRTSLVLNLGLLALLLSACLTPTPPANVITSTSGGSAITQTPVGSAITQTPGGGAIPAWGKQTKTSGCKAVDVRPDPACTPGDVLQVTKDEICKSGYSSSVRLVTDAEKNKVYEEYGVATHNPGEYELDHFVSLELGGSNDISNLWPEPAAPKPGFHEKDKVENYLHDQVCSGALTLKDAQVKIATNWLAVYNQMPNK
jgi:hypothetical protein